VYADYVSILGWSVHTIKKNIDAFVVASKEIGLEVNADETKQIGMSRNQNVGQSRRKRLIMVPLKVGRVQIFENNLNESKFYSGIN